MKQRVELLEKQLSEIDKRIEEFSLKNNSPILTIPGISHFSGTSIISELGDICNYTKASQIIKFAGVAPYHYESSQFTAHHTAITKKGSKYLRKTLYQIILPVISNNEVFYAYYTKKLNEGKGHRCAQGHCIRKLLRDVKLSCFVYIFTQDKINIYYDTKSMEGQTQYYSDRALEKCGEVKIPGIVICISFKR